MHERKKSHGKKYVMLWSWTSKSARSDGMEEEANHSKKIKKLIYWADGFSGAERRETDSRVRSLTENSDSNEMEIDISVNEDKREGERGCEEPNEASDKQNAKTTKAKTEEGEEDSLCKKSVLASWL